jgi:glycosyltransferase involved in cell wall biosynthesis
MRFEPGGDTAGRAGVCRIDRLEDWDGVRVYEVVNSPVLAPSLAQFRDPLGEIAAPELEARVRDLVRDLAPDVVHFHNIEGFSAGCIPAIRSAAPAARIVFSLHNYHTVCPQVYLMQGHRRPCWTFENGNACTACIPAPDPAQERARLMAHETPGPKHVEAPAAPGGEASGARAERPGMLAAIRGWAARLGRSPELPAWPPRFVPGRGPHVWYAEDVPAWRPLLNVIRPEAPSDKPPNEYAARRAAMVTMLNSCDRVLAVSEFVSRKFEAMGVLRDRLRTLHIGSRMAELATRRSPPSPLCEPGSAVLLRPIRMAFMGYNNWYKGLPMLADALELLTPEVLGRIDLHVYALEGGQMEPQFRELEPRLGGLTLRHGYRYEEIPSLLAGIDLGLVTSVWWDNAPQTVMEFQACGVPVLAADLGGIPDFVRDGENGALYRGNDRWDLARKIAWLTANPGVIAGLRAGVRPPKGIAEHAGEMEQIYLDRLS